MQDILEEFEDRALEIDIYFDTLGLFHENGASISIPTSKKDANKIVPIGEDLTAIMKANAFLMLYNLVEWSIREGILSVYREMDSTSCSYEQVRVEIRKIWSKYQFRKTFDVNSSWETYYSKAAELIEHTLGDKTIKMDRKAIPISGNLDADQIRLIFDLHGIKKSVPAAAKGGSSLEEIKEQRNLLAHGSLGFSECGRQFELTQIKNMKTETIHFIRGMLKNIHEYF
jgi:hypothetical protein